MTEKFVNHYGTWVGSETATTGVLNSNSIMWEWVNDEICLTCEEIYQSIEDDKSLDEDEKQSELDFIECDSSHTRIFGDWILDTKTHQYTPDKNGEFAAIENESTVQVIWSKYTTRGALCSPCYPGQVDNDSTGDFLAYTLPDYLLYKDDEL
jgi:hypothetical protein